MNQWAHLRISFSWVLAPVIFLALAAAGGVPNLGFWMALICQCLFLYPASHAFNSFYDRDTGPIATLLHPPAVNQRLLITAFALDAVAVALGLTISFAYALWLVAYGLASKCYSHPWLRLKARPWAGWIVVSFFQGGLTFLFTVHAITSLSLGGIIRDPFFSALALLATVWTGAFYPITQVYQHEEDARRGDLTLSRKLGILGTWSFAAVGGAFSVALMTAIAIVFERWGLLIAIAIGMGSALIAIPGRAERLNPDWKSVSRLAWVSASGLNLSLIFYCGWCR